VSALSLGTRQEGGRTVVSLTGELDLATVGSLREVAMAELTAAECETLVVDLAGLTFLDSTGLGCWIDLRNQTLAQGKQLEFRHIPPIALRTVTTAGLADLFGMASAAEPAYGGNPSGNAGETAAGETSDT
jgi:anti-anti-sigma factor